MLYFIDVILPLPLPKSFTYRVTETEFYYIKNGMRVAVPFGKNKIYTGLVLDKHQNTPVFYEAKEIDQILDEEPIVTPIQLIHWKWVADYYMCTLGEVYKGALPSAFLLESETVILKEIDVVMDPEALSDEEYLIYESLQRQSELKISDIINITGKKNVIPILKRLLEKKLLRLWEKVEEVYKPKLVRYIKLHEQYVSDRGLNELLTFLQKAPKQKALVLSYFQWQAVYNKPITAKHLIEMSQSTLGIVKTLIDKGIFEEYYVQQDRMSQRTVLENKTFTLSDVQQNALSDIFSQLDKQSVCLLHGVTSAGKTEIYIKVIEKYIAQGGQVLYLLPEIALTVQLVYRLRVYFGDLVVVYHSKFSNHEKVEIWHAVLSSTSKAQIIIGTRSALFLPFRNLKLVVVDEEHEQTFKQVDVAPRYQARDASIVLAHQHDAKVLLGSATPSIETFFNAKTGKYGLVSLSRRYGAVLMPFIELVDLKDRYKRKRMVGHFSDTLREAMAEVLSKGEQVILFQNRRGYSPIIECNTCGHVPKCIQCDVSLTYHKYKNQLRCHYCGYSITNPVHCHQCHSSDVMTKGFGTEQIELELKELFPDKTSARMDQDTTRGKYAYEKIIDAFKNREIDILVGTQMLSKGLDFDNITLVGIMNADNMLYHPDFRALERSFQTIMQVAGRAGRAEKRGKVCIQTYNPYHDTIRHVTNNDFMGMYEEQLYQRQIYFYPPYYRLIKVTLKHKNFDILKEGAMWLYHVMKQQLSIPILGPEEPPINRIRNEYIRTIMIKIPQKDSLSAIKNSLRRSLDRFETISQYRAIKVLINVDVY